MSAPAFAGLVTQLNAKIRSTPGLRRQTIGFMNPFLYWAAAHYPKAFRDITKGSNFKFSGNFTRCQLGYYAAAGWEAAQDPVCDIIVFVLEAMLVSIKEACSRVRSNAYAFASQ